MSPEEYGALLHNHWSGNPDVPMLYQPLEHPYFNKWPAQQPCQERWDMIERSTHLSTPGVCLDLGCHTGWFCRQFSHFGWVSIGIDKDPVSLSVARGFMSAFDGDPKPEYIEDDLCNLELPRADITLCLSLVMYLFPENGPESDGWNFLWRVSLASPIMFLDYGGDYSGHLPRHLEQGVIDNTDYSSYRLLGRTSLQSRPFYIFQR